jgi:hypothetical protein
LQAVYGQKVVSFGDRDGQVKRRYRTRLMNFDVVD